MESTLSFVNALGLTSAMQGAASVSKFLNVLVSLVIYVITIDVFVTVGFFQTKEESVLCSAGRRANSLADKDGTKIKRCKKTLIEL